MKSLKFTKYRDGHYVIIGYRGAALGVIEPKGDIFKKCVVSKEFERDTEMTAECHRQMADFMDSLEIKNTSRSSAPQLCSECIYDRRHCQANSKWCLKNRRVHASVLRRKL